MFRIRVAALLTCAVVVTACGSTPSNGSPDSGFPYNGNGGGGGGQDAGGNADAGTLPELSWYRDVLPIVQDSCQGCHVEGGIGPFPLETYAQAKPMAGAMAGAVAARRMPPWMPDAACNSYKDERRLTQAQIDTIVAWSQQGAPEGDPNDAPPPPGPPAALPWVDATLDSGVDYTPSTAAGPDDYHCFILDPALSASKDVVGFDIVPGVRSMVHHVLLYSADKTNALNVDAQTPNTPGWTCFGGPGTSNPQVVGGWVPGTPVTQYPEGTGIRMQAGKVLVMQIHYNTEHGAPTPDRTVVKLQYSKTAVAKVAQIVPQAQGSFAIPPSSTGYSVTDTSQPLPVNVTVFGVLPHMHTKGSKIKVSISPSDTCLVDIPAWDFHWQQFYMFKTPVQVAAGQSSVLTCTWDNPTGQTVTWGEGTSDEMCLNYYYLTIP